MIAGASRELVDSTSDIVWAIDPQKDHLNDLTQRMRRFASDVLTSRNIGFEFREPDEEDDVPLGAKSAKGLRCSSKALKATTASGHTGRWRKLFRRRADVPEDSKVEALLKMRGLTSGLTLMIATGVEGLDNLGVLMPAMRILGRAHREPGAKG